MREKAVLGLLMRGLKARPGMSKRSETCQAEVPHSFGEARQDHGIHLLRIEAGEVIAIKNKAGIPDPLNNFAELNKFIPPHFVETLKNDFGFDQPTA